MPRTCAWRWRRLEIEFAFASWSIPRDGRCLRRGWSGLGGRVVEIDVAEIFHRTQRSNGRRRYQRSTEIEICQLRERRQLLQAIAGDVGFFEVQCAQMREPLQRVETGVGDGGAAQFGFHDVGGEFLELCELSVTK